jgi:hypothetical protein
VAALLAWPVPGLASERSASPNGFGPIGRLLYGEDSVKSASFSLVLTIGKATGTSSGVYNFATATGRNEADEAGHAHWVMVIRGSTMYWPTHEFMQLMDAAPRQPLAARQDQ